MQNEVVELEELHKMKDGFYEAKKLEMKEFKQMACDFVVKCELEVQSLRNGVNELRSSFMDLKGNKRNSCNSEIDAAEARRLRLLAEKESVCRNVDSNSQLKAQLQKQLQSIM
ncbi:hypothetical protein KIW84_073337 [Lathyrus oleraceus]|nr:hypothetical protein KIW84_073337 [Pisum sativum]